MEHALATDPTESFTKTVHQNERPLHKLSFRDALTYNACKRGVVLELRGAAATGSAARSAVVDVDDACEHTND